MLKLDPAVASHVSPPATAGGQPLALALGFLVIAAAAILGALAFEHLGGYQPCALCLMQRTPYYAEIPVAVALIGALLLRAPSWLAAALFGVLAVLALYNSGLGVYHAGVEWKLWEGPATCSLSVAEAASAADMLNQLATTHAPSCTDATWRMFGLSFAGWNALISALLAAMAIGGAASLRRTAR